MSFELLPTQCFAQFRNGLLGRFFGIPFEEGNDGGFAHQFDADHAGVAVAAGVVGVDLDARFVVHALLLHGDASAQGFDVDAGAVAADPDDAIAVAPGSEGGGDHSDGKEAVPPEPDPAEEAGVLEEEDADRDEAANDEEANA